MNYVGKKIRRLAYLIFLLLTLFPCLVFMPSSGKAEQNSPTEAINKLNATLLEAMKRGKELGYEGRRKLLAPVIKDSFALSQMARVAAGKYWETFSEEERTVYLNTYVEWTVAGYAGRFDEYSGEQFRVLSESDPENGKVSVISKLTASNGDEVEFNYQFRRLEGEWRIVDIRILGVSQLALTRVQFVNILEKKGCPGLITMLSEKISALSQAKG